MADSTNPISSPKISLHLERPRTFINLLRHLKFKHKSEYRHTQFESGYNEWFRSRRVCAECQEIFQYWYQRADWSSKRYLHQHHSLNGLEKSAVLCPICELFVNSLDDRIFDAMAPEDKTTRGTINVEALQVPNNTSHEVQLAFKTGDGDEDLKGTVNVFPTGMFGPNIFRNTADS
jgi:hypothetical protein